MTDTENPQPGRKSVFLGRVQLGLLILLCLYWLLLFTGTHISEIPGPINDLGDKFLHLVAYGGLAVLLLTLCVSKGPVSFRTVALIWFVIVGYGIFDESTQLFVGRNCDPMDWITDVIGATIGLAVTWPAASFLLRPVKLTK